MSQNSHIYAPFSIDSSSIFEDKNRQQSLQANDRSGGGGGLFTLSESSRHPPGPEPFHHVSHSRKTTEMMRPSCPFEQRLLITEKILLNTDGECESAFTLSLTSALGGVGG